MLYKAYKTSQYHSFGDRMIDTNQEDEHYHDSIGIKIYLIQQYQTKINGNSDFNKTKGKYINKAIYAIIYSTVLCAVSILFISICKI